MDPVQKDNPRGDADQDDFDLPTIPAAPDGGPAIGAIAVGQPTPAPERTPENFICLRGPCQHYWHLVTMADAGNPHETWEALGIEPPRQHHHVCLVNPGYETSFADDNAFECSKWSPYTKDELIQIKIRREKYHKEQSPK
jgi:hypothetical protein